jgi:hypothetical protein
MPGGTYVLIVSNDADAVELDLAAGRFTCPGCGVGALSRWGFARHRVLRDGQGFRPRRGACGDCGSTHVFLPDVCLVRRRDSVEVIGAVVSAGSLKDQVGVGDRLGVPPDTVRGWRRRFRRWAEAVRAHFTRWLLVLAPGRPLPELCGSAPVDALEAVGLAARAASLRLGVIRPAWSWASALTAGALLSNTSSSWPTPD